MPPLFVFALGWLGAVLAVAVVVAVGVALVMPASLAAYAMIFGLWRALFPKKGLRLYRAALVGDLQAAQRLLDKGAEVNWIVADVGHTPLHAAAMEGHSAAARLLISSGAALDLKDKDGWTALHHAAKRGQKEVVDLLLARAKAGYDEAISLAQHVTSRSV